ncbi:cellulose-binding protein [Actinoplanes sp. ATCC 53533]|uniref:cellulose binding domain-containing protein n=1 Tax=Actinoplanes sp. ATCC 53533 TaxID=1288362 RepID=UPI000F78DB56|nr:cellulose binding domain-containing protein [Actinoplanes sp. ATCC 53533]RSM74119.1 cellulose-binding protein [Actinoplanes sp. ATCC 53533]
MMFHRPRRVRLIAAGLAAVVCGAAATVTTTAHAAASGCRVDYAVGSQWTGGFSANVTVTNLGDAVTGWTLRWSFTAGQVVTQAWSATATQSGAAVTAVNAGWNGQLATNGSTSFGFNGSWNNASNPVPASFSLNGVTCTGSTTPGTPSPTVPATTPPTATPSTPAPQAPPTRTVRVFWLKPTDVAYDQRYPDGIAGVMREAQSFFRQQLGKTFTLNGPVVEVVNGQHDTNWYINNNCDPNGDRYACVIFNMQSELQQRFGLRNPDSRWLFVAEVSAEEVGKSGGGAQPGWVLLSGHDADGAAGKTEPMPRWYGGMVHELGHAFGLPDATSTDGTCMSASFYGYPNCTFNQTQKNGILNGPYGSFLS